MTTIAIEINDAGLTVASAERVLAVEPGYALLEKRAIVTGEAARRQARLRPQQTRNRFWSELSLEHGSAGAGDPRSSAEIAFAQLRDLWQPFADTARDAVLLVPGHYGKSELGLLLGLAQECGMPVRAMLNAAAAASVRPYPGRQLLYLDASLHRVAVTPLRQGEEVTALDEKGLASVGLASLSDAFVKRIAEMFVLATRFDPLHRAESEQALYDLLPGWLAALRESESAELALAIAGEELRVTVERAQLLGATAGFYKALVQLVAQSREAGGGLVVQISDRLARQPGLLDELGRLDDALVVAHEPGQAALAALAALGVLDRGEQVRLLRHLPWRAEAAAAPALDAAPVRAAPITAGPRPTHVVYRGVAYPVNGEGLLVGRASSDGRRTILIEDQSSGVSRSHCELALANGELVVRDLSSYGTYVNERRVSGEEVLHPADVIRIGSPGAELEIIRVEP